MANATLLEAPADPDGLEQTLQGLSALIAAIFEDAHLLAAKGARDAHGDTVLRQSGEDVAALASAMQIIRRRLPA